MSAAADRINAILARFLPLVVGVIVVAFGYDRLVQPGIADFSRSRAEAQTLEARVRALEQIVARTRGLTWPDQANALKLFEERVSKEDRVADVAEWLTRAVAESATDGKLRNLAMGTGDLSATGAPGQTESIDLRWGFYPYRLTHSPVTLSFDASYGTIVNFFSKIRNLPTAIEIRSVKLTRGLPLMSAQVTVLVFRRGDILPGAGLAGPARPGTNTASPPGFEPPSTDPLVPRIVEPRGPGG